jgi:hypothetical protein
VASKDTTRAASPGFGNKVLDVLRDPTVFPPEFAAWVRSQIVRNPLVKMEPFQLPTLDKKHIIGAAGEIVVFQNSWAAYGSGYEVPSYWKDSASVVHLQGLMTGGTIPAVAFTLPPGYRPLGQLIFDVQSNSALARVDVFPSGGVQPQSGAAAWVNLSGISFRIQ